MQKPVLIIALIFLPLSILSQKATINHESETVLLDKNKAIDVAKIIKNEERLRGEVEVLIGGLVDLNDRIQNLEETASAHLIEIDRLADENARLLTELMELRANARKPTKVPKNGLFYFSPSVVTNFAQIQNIHLNGTFRIGSGLLTFGADPITDKNISYNLGIGFKIF